MSHYVRTLKKKRKRAIITVKGERRQIWWVGKCEQGRREKSQRVYPGV